MLCYSDRIGTYKKKLQAFFSDYCVPAKYAYSTNKWRTANFFTPFAESLTIKQCGWSMCVHVHTPLSPPLVRPGAGMVHVVSRAISVCTIIS